MKRKNINFVNKKQLEKFNRIFARKIRGGLGKLQTDTEACFNAVAKERSSGNLNLTTGNMARRAKKALAEYGLLDWARLALSVHNFLPEIVNTLEAVIDSTAVAPRVGNWGTAVIDCFEEMASYLDEKDRLINLYVVGGYLLKALTPDEDAVIRASVMHQTDICDIEKIGNFRQVYRKRDKILKRLKEILMLKNCSVDWFYNEFAGLPIVQYYAL